MIWTFTIRVALLLRGRGGEAAAGSLRDTFTAFPHGRAVEIVVVGRA